MTKILLIPPALFLVFSGCSGRQKRACNQPAAYQHGYQAAQKGETVDGSSLYEGQICKDFDEYSSTLYRQDFKAGWTKGKREYCTDSNYVRWGNEDGEKGRVAYPNNYSDAMKICLQDNEYKSKAMKKYKGGFIHSFCSLERMEKLGRKQAKKFEAFKSPLIKKHCGNDSSKLIAKAKATYKEQMQANCTTSFWLVKGEEDAQAKRSKATEIAKVQKCPALVRDTLISQYSTAFNERKALMLQEEKLAFERQKEKERLEMEREKQRQQYELERQRTQILSDAVNNTTGGGAAGGVRPRPLTFYHQGHRLTSLCEVHPNDREAVITVRNESNRNFSLSGQWEITYFGRDGRRLRSNRERETMIFSGYERETFEDRFAPFDSFRCEARFRG